MSYAALKAEIALPAYAGLTDAQIVAALNAATIEAWRLAGQPRRDHRRRNGRQAELSDATKRTAFTAMLDALVSAGAITADHKTGLLALAAVKTSRSEQLGLPGLTAGDLQSARAA